MAIPTNYIDKITKDGESRDICPAAGKVRVDNENFEGADLNEVLNEIFAAIESAASGGYAPPEGGIPATDLTQAVQDILNDVANKVDKIPGKGLSTNDFTDALLAKLNNLDPYTKAEVNAVIQQALSEYSPGETVVASVDDIDIVDNPNGQNADTILAAASARMVKEIYINVKALFQNLAGMAFVGEKPTWQTVPVRTYTIGMASADSKITLTDGNGSPVTSPQPEGTPLTLRLSVANGYRFAAAPTALMGNTEIEFTLDGSYYVATIGALAGNIVITASSVEMGTYSVNIPTGAVFCTSTGAAASSPSIEEGEGVTCYIKPADGRRWVTPPSSTGATVTLQSGSIYKIVASNVQADITVSGSTEAIPTYNITVPNDANITVDNGSGGSVPASVLEGSPLTIRLTPANDYSISVTSAKMGQQDLTPTNVNGVLTFTIASVTNHVTIVATAAQVVAHAINLHLLNMSSSNNASQVIDGQPFSTTITPDTGCTDNDMLKVFMDGVRLTAGTDYTYNSSTGALSIPSVTGDIDIAASAAQGTVTIKANESGAAYTITKNDNSTVTITCDTADGELFVGSASGITSFKSIKVSGGSNLWNNGKIVEIDLGGAKFTGDAKFLFYQCQKLVKIDGLVVNGTTNLQGTFQMNKITTIDLWHVESVGITSFLSMFQACGVLETINGMCGLVTSSATSVASMFYNCSKLASIDTRGWDLSSVTNFGTFASEALLLGDLDISISSTGLMTNVGSAFYKANTLHTLTIGDFKVGENATVTNFGLVSGASNGIKTIICKTTTPPVMGTDWLATITNLNSIIVPSGSKAAYDAAQGWSTYANIITEES